MKRYYFVVFSLIIIFLAGSAVLFSGDRPFSSEESFRFSDSDPAQASDMSGARDGGVELACRGAERQENDINASNKEAESLKEGVEGEAPFSGFIFVKNGDVRVLATNTQGVLENVLIRNGGGYWWQVGAETGRRAGVPESLERSDLEEVLVQDISFDTATSSFATSTFDDVDVQTGGFDGHNDYSTLFNPGELSLDWLFEFLSGSEVNCFLVSAEESLFNLPPAVEFF